ncbi:J domain-containing protein [Lysobacter sp. BMK333-48F3]|uniref:J domain-containing protein n=1 Tax=Lysobacter sp. BMK333-48F3 TaxID=2867962 RepID=UPI001C8C4B6E|nr:J domain-containing protein [Lysobacter sp. BMK333-48F3]MBX9402680.1 J domain-containing protein [Lysobacter sp. BMK333-48F3]
MSPFATLGLEENADGRQIKRAYANAIRQARPDEDPAGFQRINEAYRAALELAQERERTGQTSVQPAIVSAEPAGGDQASAAPHGPALPAEIAAPTNQPAAVACSPGQESPSPNRRSERAPSIPIRDPARDSETDWTPPNQIAREILGEALARSPDAFSQWLRDYPPLYSLKNKHDAAIALVPLLIDQTALPIQTLDAISDFFDLEALGTYPPHVHSTMRAARGEARLNYPVFRSEIERRCQRSSAAEFKRWLYAQEELHDRHVRRSVGEKLHSWLAQDDLLRVPPPLVAVLVEFFGYEDARLLSNRKTAAWSLETENTAHWGEHSRFPIQQLKRRFGLLRALVIAVAIPGMPQRIARIAKRLIDSYQGIPAQMDADQLRFFADFASTAYFGPWRWIAIALRGALGIAAAMIAQVVLKAPNDGLFLSIPAMVIGTNLLVICIDYLLLRRSRRTGSSPH